MLLRESRLTEERRPSQCPLPFVAKNAGMIKHVIVAAALLACSALPAAAAAPFQIDGGIGLSSLIALSDGRLQAISTALEVVAADPQVRTGRWTAIETPLHQAAKLGLPGELAFIATNGTLYTEPGGEQRANLSYRSYVRNGLHGRVTIGELVSGHGTGTPEAIVAVPIRNDNGTVVGVLDDAIDLNAFSAQLKRDLGIGPNVIFWAIDGTGKIAIHSDATNVLVEPAKMSPALARVRDEMLAHDAGEVTYTYRGAKRMVIYRKSSISDWRYGFGVVVP